MLALIGLHPKLKSERKSRDMRIIFASITVFSYLTEILQVPPPPHILLAYLQANKLLRQQQGQQQHHNHYEHQSQQRSQCYQGQLQSLPVNHYTTNQAMPNNTQESSISNELMKTPFRNSLDYFSTVSNFIDVMYCFMYILL